MASIFHMIATEEAKLENLRVELAEDDEFAPKQLFNFIKTSNTNNKLIPNDLLSYMSGHGVKNIDTE